MNFPSVNASKYGGQPPIEDPLDAYGNRSMPQQSPMGGPGPSEQSPLMGGPGSPGGRSSTRKGTKLKLPAEESVYGAVLFLPPISRLTTGRDWDRPARLAILLCIMNALLQLGVVRVLDVYGHEDRLERLSQVLNPDEVLETGDDQVARTSRKWQNRASNTKDGVHHTFLPPHEKAAIQNIESIDPLCTRIGDGNGTFTCMPHSVKFVYEWDKLDTNGDGVWTHAEAVADIAGLRERIHVSPQTIFNNMINGLRMSAEYAERHNKTLYLSQDVSSEKAIPKAYFNFWKGDAMMCSHFDSNSCEAAAKAGIFDAALKGNRLSAHVKGIHDLDSAISYCYRMLQTGGGCETLLPTDFKRNREQRWGRCGERSLIDGGKYTNPYNSAQSVHILEATYHQVSLYARATSRLYMLFLSLVIMLWLLALIDEWRELIKGGEFLIQFPALRGGDIGGTTSQAPEDSDSEPDVTFKITAISNRHRAVLVFFYVIRVLVCVILTWFGTHFLLDETDYLSLVMNSLALTFILTIDSMLFELMEKDVKNKLANSKPIEFYTRLPTKGWGGYFLKKECWGLFLVPVLALYLVLSHNYQQREPILTVLRCACTQEGEKCLDSANYASGWWQNYWSKDLPSAIHQIEALRIAGK